MGEEPRCDYSDLYVSACAHCQTPQNRLSEPRSPSVEWNYTDEISGSQNGAHGLRRVDLFGEQPIPAGDDRPPLRLAQPGDGICACGYPTRDRAYCCDACSDELARILGDAPWIAEQLDLTITRQRAKRPGSEGAGDGIPWHEKASNILHALRNELVNDVRTCTDDHVRNSSPDDGQPADTIASMSRWLLWRVDGLALHEGVTEMLRTLLRIEGNALHAIDRAADRKFLGWCTADFDGEQCGAAVYASDEAAVGHCNRPGCRTEYETKSARRALEKALDDRLLTAAEIAHLSTYLSLTAGRERVRNVVNQWHKRGRITAHGHGVSGDPTFRYGQVRVLLAVAYEESEGA